MATPSKIHLTPDLKPEYFVPGLTTESAEKATKLLQENHDKHHIFFNKGGFHNHIAHHLLTLFALNASPSSLQTAYSNNVSYQRPPEPLKKSIVNNMHDPRNFKSYLGKEQYYHDFLIFFQDELTAKGVRDVLEEYCFRGDERADDMLARLFSGFLHPIIHLGFGIEFSQPAIIAEALAQAAVHGNWMKGFYADAEKAASERGEEKGKRKSIVQLLEEIRSNEKLSTAAHWEDGNKIRDGILKRANQEMIDIASQYRIPPDCTRDELEERMAEMVNAVVYYTSSSQNPPHLQKFDFYFMHCVNSTIFFSNFLRFSQTSQTPASSSTSSSPIPPSLLPRLLTYKIRTDLLMYASRRSPKLLVDEITSYPSTLTWSEIEHQAIETEDDGHTAKLIRALRSAEKVCGKFEGKEGFMLNGEDWRRVGGMVVESVRSEPRWVRSAGFEEAWGDVGVRDGMGEKL